MADSIQLGEDFMPLVAKFETLQRLFGEEAEAERKATIHLELSSKSGHHSTVTAFFDRVSTINWITQSACDSLRISDQEFSNAGNKSYVDIRGDPVTPEKKILLRWSSSRIDPPAGESEFFVSPPPQTTLEDVTLGEQFVVDDRLSYQGGLGRLKFWASDISDLSLSQDISASYVLQVLDDSQSDDSRVLVQEIREVFDAIARHIGRPKIHLKTKRQVECN
jgi:hypothetical protein